jgi:hypothetical protein
MKKQILTPAQTYSDAFDKIFAQVDPEVILAGALGAIAAGGGITPPLTRILMAFNSGSLATVDLGFKEANDAFNTWYGITKYASPIMMLLGIRAESGTPSTQEEAKASYTHTATMASGALEAMVVMSLVKNPATITAIGTAIGGVASKAGAAAALL